jgi:hypothetical protein
MAKLNFRSFKYVVLYAGAAVVIIGALYWLGNLFQFWQWTDQNRSLIGRVWSALTSPKGVVIFSGMIAVFIVATILVERQLDRIKDVKWRRRMARLNNRVAKLDRPRKTLSEGQMRHLLAMKRRGHEINQVCLSGGGSQEEIEKWENDTAQALRSSLDDEPADRFLHEPSLPASVSGTSTTQHRVGRVQTRMRVLSEIIKEFGH